jgi:hypothetical protein
MSKTPLLGLLPAMILAGALCAERSAVAGVILHDSLDQVLVASTAPMPLGPIASAGRTKLGLPTGTRCRISAVARRSAANQYQQAIVEP